MNRTYSLVWSVRLQCYAVASETTRRRGKSGGLKPLAAMLLSTLAISAHALPEGGQVSAVSGSIATVGTTTTITQQTQNMAINWQKFGTASNESIVFQQPNASAIALNRVLGNESSTLSGSLKANGQVWILNPNGVMFGAGSQVNVGGLLATTLKMSDDDFMSGKRSFSNTDGTGGLVTNRGNITTTDGGYVALLGGQVSNEGVIAARLGTVALAAGNSMTLDFAGDKLLNVQVDQGALNALAQNKQMISADGGVVLMTAKGVDALLNAVVNNDGVIEARTIGDSKGKITLLSDMDGGITTVAGRLDASAPDGGDGGFIETSGAKVVIADGVTISTDAPILNKGQWLIRSNDFTIAASGGNISGSTLSSRINYNNITISTVRQGTAGGNG